MDTYTAGENVTFSVPFVDERGERIAANSVLVSVTDADGASVLAPSEITLAPEDLDIEVMVPAALNTLADGETVNIRSVLIRTTDNAFTTNVRYYIRSLTPLVPCSNSFQTMERAMLVAADFANLSSWGAADCPHRRRAALTEAWTALTRLPITVCGVRVPETTWTDRAAFDALPASLRNALLRAQVAEADALLVSDNSYEAKRQLGLTFEAIGESKVSFAARTSSSVAERLGVSARALRQLVGWLRLDGRVERA